MLYQLLLLYLQKFCYSVRKREFSIAKTYLCDIGFSKISEFSENIGKKMENVVFLELMRRNGIFNEVSYWKDSMQNEVDFVVKEKTKIKQLIQVCYNIEDYDTKKREIRALIKASKELKCKNLIIITYDKDGFEKIKQKN
jgi:predicted AAA+ superfamily ATPase